MTTLTHPTASRRVHRSPRRPELPARTVDRLDALIAEQERIFLERQPAAAGWHQRAMRSLAGGVTSSWQISRPQPIWIEHGAGSRLWDVDGNEYVDTTPDTAWASPVTPTRRW